MPNLLALLGTFNKSEDIPSCICSLLLKLFCRTVSCHGPQFLITSAFFHLDLHHPAAAPLVPNASLHAGSPGLVNNTDYNIQKHKSLMKLLPPKQTGLKKKHSVCWEMRNKLSQILVEIEKQFSESGLFCLNTIASISIRFPTNDMILFFFMTQ